MRRVFVQVSEDEWAFLQTLRNLVKGRRGRKYLPPLRGVVTGIIRDYRRILEESSVPDFLDAYRLAEKRKTSTISREILSGARQDFDLSSIES